MHFYKVHTAAVEVGLLPQVHVNSCS